MNKPLKSTNKNSGVRSLQSQYIVTALLLGSIVLIAATLGYLNILSTSKKLTMQAENTARILNLTADIRKSTNHAYSSIQAFMLNPEHNAYIKTLHQDIEYSLKTLLLIKNSELNKQLELQLTIDKLTTEFNKLQSEASLLFSIRINANEQYPALGVSSNVMRPMRNEILSALSLSLLEHKDDPVLMRNLDAYTLLNDTLLSWVTTLSEYRLYLTNRMGSFDPVQLLEQEKNVNAHVLYTKELSLELVKLNSLGQFGFESNALIDQVPSYIDQWIIGFERVRNINHLGIWRKDSRMLESYIIPLISSINHNLKKLDKHIAQEYEIVLNNQTDASSKQNKIMIGIIFIFLVYIIVSIKLLQHFIIKPISTMAKAIKNEAYQKNGIRLLSLNKTRETEDLIEAFSEMSHQVFKRQDELEFQATHDTLTQLPNRLMLHQRMDYHLSIALRDSQSLVFMMLDLNRFKDINDTLGHHVGDGLLVQLGERLLKTLRDVDTVARLGGDEFAILLPNTNSSQARNVAINISKSLEKKFSINTYELHVSASIGIAEYPNDGHDSNTLIQHADVAMYIAKRKKSGFHIYHSHEDTHSISRLSLGDDLKIALESDLLDLNFQPQYLMSTGEIIGAEALLRWHHPNSGFISPELVVSLAEDIGIIHALSHWVIKNAFEFCSHNLQHAHDVNIAINLSVQNLQDPELIETIKNYLEIYKINSNRIVFEITESAVMTNPEKSIEVLNKLSALGVQLSVDDFGTGFSSLAYLKLLPVNELKIDKSFVMDIVDDASDRLIVHSTIELSHNLGLSVVAEGIESDACWNMLHNMGCDTAQGYYMSRPLNKQDFYQLLETENTTNHSL